MRGTSHRRTRAEGARTHPATRSLAPSARIGWPRIGAARLPTLLAGWEAFRWGGILIHRGRASRRRVVPFFTLTAIKKNLDGRSEIRRSSRQA